MQGRRFEYPPIGQGQTRFTPGLLKKAVFEILLNRIANSSHKVKDYAFFDLSAGSGQMAFEALSLGFQKVYISEVEASYTAHIKKQLGAKDKRGHLVETRIQGLDPAVPIEIYCRDFRRMSSLIRSHSQSILYFDLPYSFWKARNPLGLEGFLSRLENSFIKEEAGETKSRWIFIQGPRFFEVQKMKFIKDPEFRRYGRQHLSFWLSSSNKESISL